MGRHGRVRGRAQFSRGGHRMVHIETILPVTLLWLLQTASGLNAAPSGKVIPTYAGAYRAVTDKLYHCDETSAFKWYMHGSSFNPAKPKELQHYTGNITVTEALDDNYYSKLIIDRRSNNQWKENAFVFYFPKRGCTNCMTYCPVFYRLYENIDKKPCSFNPGVTIHNKTPMNWTFPTVPILPYGHYRLRGTVGKLQQERDTACIVVEFNLIPKPL